METKKFKTRVDWWIAAILFLVGFVMPFIFILAIILEWVTGADAVVLGIAAAFTAALIVAVFILSYVAAYYELDAEGLMARNIFFTRKRVLYDKIVSVSESVNVLNRPKTWAAPLSVVGVRVDYIKEDATPSWFFIAPKNRHEFIQILQNRIK